MRRISHKIWIGTMSVVAFLCIMMWGFQQYFLEDLYIRKLISTVSFEVFQVLDGFDAKNPENTYFKLDSLAYRLNISVEIVNINGKTIYVTGENPGTKFESIGGKENLQSVLLASKTQLGNVLDKVKGSTGSSTEPGKSSTGGSGQGSGEGQGTGTGAGAGTGTGAGTGSGSGAGAGTGAGAGAGTGAGSGAGGGQGTDNESTIDEPEEPAEPQSGMPSKGTQFMPEGEIKDNLISDGLDGKTDIEEISHPKYGFRLLVLSIPFNSIQGDPYVALAAIPMAQINDIIRLASMALLIAIPIILIIAGIASYLIASTISRPIKKLRTAAEAIGEGNLDARADVISNDEVGSLGGSFNIMAEQLQKADSMKREFVENVSHELRTPISVIRGYAETIRDVTGENKEKRNAQLNVISNEANRLGIMVSDILDYSRITTYGIELEVTEFDMSDLIQELTNKYQVLVKDSKISISCESEDHLIVKGDRTRLEQALENLLRNAVNYSPDGGAVKVLGINNSDNVRVEVRDQGVGIPIEELPMIWERYYRTRGIKRRKIYGSGLGLSIVKSILETHKALFGVDSVQGEGTTFWFELTKTGADANLER